MSKKKKKADEPEMTRLVFEYEIVRVRVLNFNLNGGRVLRDGQPLHFNLVVNHHVPAGLKTMEVRSRVNVLDDAPEGEELVSITTLCTFSISGLEQVSNQSAVVLPKELMKRITNVAVGTTRGLLIAKNSNTSLEEIVMPVVADESIDFASPVEGLVRLDIGKLNWPPDPKIFPTNPPNPA